MVWLLVVSVVVAAVALLHARREYRSRGRLTVFGMLLLCAMLFVPNLVLDYATTYAWPSTPLDYLGVLLAIVGLTLCAMGMLDFRSVTKILCLKQRDLTVSGIYRFSRNPQYAGWLLFLLGFALNDWSLWCLAALLVVALSLHLLVLVEEEHLRRAFGEQYVEFVRKTPRYIGWFSPSPPGRI